MGETFLGPNDEVGGRLEERGGKGFGQSAADVVDLGAAVDGHLVSLGAIASVGARERERHGRG